MSTNIDEKLKEINQLYINENFVDSLKKQCNLIHNNCCDKSILINFRKKLYSKFIVEKLEINDDILDLFKCAIDKCTFDNANYNLPFIKRAITYLEQRDCVDYNLINDWLNLCDDSKLNNNKYGNNKYTDYELFYLKKAKALDELNKEEELRELLKRYEDKNGNDSIQFFIKYHLCKLYFSNSSYTKANELLKELLLVKREKYLLGLPLKYNDYSDQVFVAFLIIELLQEKILNEYYYVYILSWLKNSDFKYIQCHATHYYKFEGKYEFNNVNKLKECILKSLVSDYKLKEFIKEGKLIKITKLGNGFISDGRNNTFCNKKYLTRKMNLGVIVKYIVIKVYSEEKKRILPQAIIVNFGG